jgi:uncharacterized protein (UPF0264 family)
MTQLLVSVRSAPEAEAALRGGAALLDVKEPAHGPLGRAGDATLGEVVRAVAGRRPVSAALGELADARGLPPADLPLAYVKWGLAGFRGGSVWQDDLGGATRALAEHRPGCRAVAVAYADWERAQAPPPEEVCDFALAHPAGAFLIDTWGKDGSTLLDWLSLREVGRLCERCRAAGVTVALAGSLGPGEIRVLLPVRPDWFAVRGAACRDRQRSAAIDEDRVRRLAILCRSGFPA